MEDGCGVPEYEVDGAGDGAGFEELAVAVDVEGVLVGFEGAAPEGCFVALDFEGHCLVVDCAGCVADCEISAQEIRCEYSCQYKRPGLIRLVASSSVNIILAMANSMILRAE